MKINSIFSFNRFILLTKQSFIINKKQIAISLAAVTGTIAIFLWMLQSLERFSKWSNNDYINTFLFLYVTIGIIYICQAFPAFRSPVRNLSYLHLPASRTEKFIFEFIVRIVAYIILMPILYWVIANIEGTIVKQFIPEFNDYRFSLFKGIAYLNELIPKEFYRSMVISGVLMIFLSSFCGGVHFTRSPMVKTLLAITFIIFGFSIYIYLLTRGFNLREYSPADGKILFISKDGFSAFAYITGTVINLTLLAMSWYGFKEKEA